MSLLTFLLVITLVAGICVTVVLAFARAVFYQSVLGELDVTHAWRSSGRRQDGWRDLPRSTYLDVSEFPSAPRASQRAADALSRRVPVRTRRENAVPA